LLRILASGQAANSVACTCDLSGKITLSQRTCDIFQATMNETNFPHQLLTIIVRMMMESPFPKIMHQKK